jgi:hypothetical protein
MCQNQSCTVQTMLLKWVITKFWDPQPLRYDIQTLIVLVLILTLQRNCLFELNSHSARQQTASKSPPDAVILHPHILFNTILPPTTRFTNWSLPLYICMIYSHYLYYSSYAIPHYEILFPTSFHILPIWPEHSAQNSSHTAPMHTLLMCPHPPPKS